MQLALASFSTTRAEDRGLQGPPPYAGRSRFGASLCSSLGRNVLNSLLFAACRRHSLHHRRSLLSADSLLLPIHRTSHALTSARPSQELFDVACDFAGSDQSSTVEQVGARREAVCRALVDVATELGTATELVVGRDNLESLVSLSQLFVGELTSVMSGGTALTIGQRNSSFREEGLRPGWRGACSRTSAALKKAYCLRWVSFSSFVPSSSSRSQPSALTVDSAEERLDHRRDPPEVLHRPPLRPQRVRLDPIAPPPRLCRGQLFQRSGDPRRPRDPLPRATHSLYDVRQRMDRQLLSGVYEGLYEPGS